MRGAVYIYIIYIYIYIYIYSMDYRSHNSMQVRLPLQVPVLFFSSIQRARPRSPSFSLLQLLHQPSNHRITAMPSPATQADQKLLAMAPAK